MNLDHIAFKQDPNDSANSYPTKRYPKDGFLVVLPIRQNTRYDSPNAGYLVDEKSVLKWGFLKQ